jgi:hypothetical protein
MERAFTALGERLARRGVVADVFVVGGAAMALAYDATSVTRDIDATFVPHWVVIEEARHVADDLGLPYRWLNEQASIYISGKGDPGKHRVFDHPEEALQICADFYPDEPLPQRSAAVLREPFGWPNQPGIVPATSGADHSL